MGDKTPATTNTNQSTTTNPWAPATPLLQNLISQYSSINPAPTAAQTGAAQGLVDSTTGIPNFGSAGTSAVNGILGQSNTPQVGMLNNGLSQLQTNLGATASGANLDPYSTPGFGDAIKTAMSDITNQVKGVYAGSGRDPSGAGSFAGSLGRGLTQGIAPTIANQANVNTTNMMNANNTLFNASGTTANNLTNTNSASTANTLAGLQGAGMIPGLYTAPGTAQLGAANTQAQLPYGNLQQMLSAAGLLGGMGSSSTGTGTSTQTPANDPMANWIGGISAGAGLLFSDARLKENIKRVGATDDGTNVYTYNFRGDPEKTPQMGMLAQELLETKPHAVHDVGGVLAVDYKAATSPFKDAGLLRTAA